MATQTLGTLTAENKTFYERTLLKRLLANLVFAKYGQKKNYKKNEGTTVNYRKFESLEIPTAPLTEGVVPTGSDLTITTKTATVNQFGDFIKTSDMIDFAGIDPVITESADLLGEQAALSIDTTVRDILVAGTNVLYAGGQDARADLDGTCVLNANEIKKAVRILRTANAKPYDGRSYIGIIDPSQEFDIMNDPLFIDANKYAHSEKIFNGEIGKLQGVRFITTTQVKVVNNGEVDVHCAMILGKDAYGVVDIEGSSKPSIFVKPLGSAGTADPINQIATVGWKACFTAVRLNELAMLRLETAVSA
jgi:N4-gp56 family major capsid protein